MNNDKDFIIYILLYAVGMSYFILLTYNSQPFFGMTVAYALMAVISLSALGRERSDEPYYRDLNREKVLLSLVAVVVMFAVAIFFNGLFGGANLLRSVLYYVQPSAYLGAQLGASSVIIAFFSDLFYQYCAVAGAEEMLTELERRYGIYVAMIPIGLWAGYHMLQSYPNALMVIPAFICGVILLMLLRHTKSILTVIFAHGTYNSLCILSDYARSPVNLPLLPTQLTTNDILLITLVGCCFTFFFLPPLLRRH